MDSVKKQVAAFGLPRIIILIFFFLLFVIAWFVNMDTASFFGDVLRRWGMWGILVLAMVPSIQSGNGPNFGVSVGILGGLVGAVFSIDMRYSGVFDFAAAIEFIPFLDGQQVLALTVAFVAMILGVSLAIVMGILYGMLLNKVKGSEMAITVYVGFSAVALFNILWARMPITATTAILPGTGFGLRQMINLRGDFDGAFDSIGMFNIGSMTVRPGLLFVFFLLCFFMWLFTRSRTGMMMSSAGSNPAYARASGINVDKMRILGTTISTALGAVGIIIYAQSFGFLQMYTAPLMMGFTAVASVLIGGASVRRARVFDVLLGAFLFNGILTIALPLTTELVPDIPGIPEMIRIVITNGIILYALTRAKGGS